MLKGCVPPRLQSSWECLRDRKNTGLGGEPRPTMDQIWPSEKKVGNVQITYQKARCILRVGRQPGDLTSRENKHYHKYELAKAKHWWINRCPWSTLDTSGLSRVWLLHTHGLQHTSFPELAQTHVHWVGDAIHPSHSLSSTSPPALYLSQHQGLFKWVGSSYQTAKVLQFQFQHQSFQWIFRTDFL